ncbi:MAG: response regulator [Deltaproteobacteria bacterium]|nr:response regulator [Deltaproteobacteria bacterium]
MITTKLLMIDDEEGFVSALSKRLAMRDIEVIPAFSGQEGLAKLNEDTSIDVILLDVKMPGMDGIETLRRIKAAHPIVEVIMLTGHATWETAIEGMKLGAFDYLMKPCEIDDLITKLEAAKKRHGEHLEKILEAAGKELRDKRAR